MQRAQAFGQRGQPQIVQHAGGQDFVHVHLRQCSLHCFAQHGLGQAVGGGVDGRQTGGQRLFFGRFNLRMYHLVALIAALDFAQRTHPLPRRQLLLVAGIKMDKPQVQYRAVIAFYLRHQLFARLELHFLMQHFALHLAHFAQRRGQFDLQRGTQGLVDVGINIVNVFDAH